MRAVRPLLLALTTLVGAFACDRSPTGPPQPDATNALLGNSPSPQTALSRSLP